MGLSRDRIAPAIYDLLGRALEKGFAPYRRGVIEHASGRALEIGAGTGFNLAHYPPEVDEIVVTEPASEGAADRPAADLRARATSARS